MTNYPGTLFGSARFVIVCILLNLTLLVGGPFTFADQEVTCAIHIHSVFSSGVNGISEIARRARKEGVDALIMTDLLAEQYEYGIWPVRGLLKWTVKRKSVLQTGAAQYLEKIRQANQDVPEVITIDGVSVTPFYYWSGNLWPGPLVLNHRAKDFLVMGLEDPRAYESLPVMGTGKSGFNPYEGDQFSLPYQKLIDEAGKKNGIVFWSHPGASEHHDFSKSFFNMPVQLDTSSYQADLISTSGYTGFGVSDVELRDLNTPYGKSAALPGGLWDQVLGEYCRGRRTHPSWVIGEVDYNGVPGQNTYLGMFLNVMRVREKSRAEVLKALQQGHFYVVYAEAGPRTLFLEEFSAGSRGDSGGVSAGDEVSVAGAPVIRIKLGSEVAGRLPVEALLVRDGKVIKQWKAETPFETSYEDTDLSAGTKSFYRIIASSPRKATLVSNPVFVRRRD